MLSELREIDDQRRTIHQHEPNDNGATYRVFFLYRDSQCERVAHRADVRSPLGRQRARNPVCRRGHGYNAITHTLSEPPRSGYTESDRRHDHPFPPHESVRAMILRSTRLRGEAPLRRGRPAAPKPRSGEGRWHRALALSTLLAACTSAPAPQPAVRSTIPIPEDRILSSFAVSADGAQLAYSAESATDGRRRLYVRALGAQNATDRELPATTGASMPFFSPDGSSIAYFARGGIW